MADLITQDQVLALGGPFAQAFAALADTERADLVTAASTIVEDYCRRSFAQATYDETYDGHASPRIWLRQRPVVAVSLIEISGDALDNSTGEAWVVDEATGELLRGNGLDDPRFAPWFPRGKRNVHVVYYAGYATVPPPVQRATLWAVRYLHERAKVSGVYQSESIGDYSYSLGSDPAVIFPAYILGPLANYVQDDGPL